jgi:hypothetical protein
MGSSLTSPFCREGAGIVTKNKLAKNEFGQLTQIKSLVFRQYNVQKSPRISPANAATDRAEPEAGRADKQHRREFRRLQISDAWAVSTESRASALSSRLPEHGYAPPDTALPAPFSQ